MHESWFLHVYFVFSKLSLEKKPLKQKNYISILAIGNIHISLHNRLIHWF